jgi:uncharacterized RDD family membrane protein YckC
MSSFERTSYSDIAGVGSRFVAALIDYIIQIVCLTREAIVFAVYLGAASNNADKLDALGNWFNALLILINFAFFAGYFALFEAYWRGQTPGKKVMKLRVIKDSGRQITFFESLARNTIRIVDYLPGLYLVGVIAMLCNKANKRLGDLAAGTLVVHERLDEQSILYQTSTTLVAPTGFTAAPWAPAQEALAPWAKPITAIFPADAVARLSAQDLIVIESFFARMLDLPMDTRAAVAYRMASQMAAKMRVPVPEGNPERTLEAIAFQMRGSGRAR